MRPLFALALVVGLASAAPVPKEVKKKDDAVLILGRWKPADGTTQWYEFRDDGTMQTWNAPNENAAVPYKWTIDSTATPKRMTWYNAKTSKVEWEAVYELDGDDLRMTYSPTPAVPKGVGKGNGIFNGQTRDTPGK